MATTEQIITLFLHPTRNRFPPAAIVDLDVLSDDLADALAPYTPHQLEQAAKHLRDTRTLRSFPTIAECKAACERFLDKPQAPVASKYQTEEMRRSLEHTHYVRRQEAYRLCRCALGETANREGWLVALVEFCEANGRLPFSAEIESVKAVARKSEDEMHTCTPANGYDEKFYLRLIAMRQDMLNFYAREVFGGEGPKVGYVTTRVHHLGATESQRARIAAEAKLAALAEVNAVSPVRIGSGLAKKLVEMRDADTDDAESDRWVLGGA